MVTGKTEEQRLESPACERRTLVTFLQHSERQNPRPQTEPPKSNDAALMARWTIHTMFPRPSGKGLPRRLSPAHRISLRALHELQQGRLDEFLRQARRGRGPGLSSLPANALCPSGAGPAQDYCVGTARR